MEFINHKKIVIVIYCGKNEVLMDKPTYLGFAIIELSELHMYETYYDKLPPHFGDEKIQLQEAYTVAFVLSLNAKEIIKHIKKLANKFDFSNIDENHELFSNKNKNVLVNLKLKLLKTFGLSSLLSKK